MDNIKVSANQFSRVTPSQNGAKERDEGFVAARADIRKDKTEGSHRSSNDSHPKRANDDNANIQNNSLVEQRRRDLAKQISTKELAQEQVKQAEELSALRQLESRAAANKQKIEGSYHAVQQNNHHHKAEEMRDKQSSSADTASKTKSQVPDPINLVV